MGVWSGSWDMLLWLWLAVHSSPLPCTWMLEMPQEAQHVNSNVKLGKQLHWDEQTPHGMVLVLQKERKNFLTQLLCLPQALPQTAILSSLPGWMVCYPVPSLEEFGSYMTLVFSSSYWIGLSNTGLSFIPTSASIHGRMGVPGVEG